MTREQENRTPTLTDVINAALEGFAQEFNTCMPAIVEKYDNNLNTVNAQPVFKQTFAGDPVDEVVDTPLVRNVPVAFPRANQAALTFPIQPGDTVLLVFSQRSIDVWKTTGGIIPPNDPRVNDLSDAIAIPGIYPSSNPVPIDPDNLVLRYLLSKITLDPTGEITIEAGAAKIVMTRSGQFQITNGGVDLLALYDATLTSIQQLTVATALGPSSIPTNVADFIQQQIQLASLKG